ncbi:MAG: sugar-binding domain-containing protein, partial [Sphaerochaetaceae bacterium]|nr:sugar-binding domain-containing protein [Sphaerochaetaceae bacterium]
KRIPKVIAISAGLGRVHSVVGALKTGIIKTLVIDELSAKTVAALLEKERLHGLEEDVKKLYGITQ